MTPAEQTAQEGPVTVEIKHRYTGAVFYTATVSTVRVLALRAALVRADQDHAAQVRAAQKTFSPGDRVIYIPMHAHGDRGHPDCERGCVSSVSTSGLHVFVRFNAHVARLGWDGATSQSCDVDSLVLESASSDQEQTS